MRGRRQLRLPRFNAGRERPPSDTGRPRRTGAGRSGRSGLPGYCRARSAVSGRADCARRQRVRSRRPCWQLSSLPRRRDRQLRATAARHRRTRPGITKQHRDEVNLRKADGFERILLKEHERGNNIGQDRNADDPCHHLGEFRLPRALLGKIIQLHHRIRKMLDDSSQGVADDRRHAAPCLRPNPLRDQG